MKKKSLLLILLMALLAPWAVKGQDLTDYTFSTGTDENQWITLTDGATTLLANAKDDEVSSKTNIGFTFPFGSGSYTQFWVNSNGVFSFSSSTSTSGSSGQFTSTYVNTAQPKICGIAKDLTTGSDGYVKSELTGTAPNRVLVCEFFTTHQYVSGYSSVSATCKWQVQLYESDSKVVIVYGSTPASAPSGYQIGLGQSSSNFWTVNPSTHTETAQTSAVSTTYSVWPGENRYYAFERPVYTCFKPQNLHATLTPGDGTIATLTWERNAQGTEDAWVLEYGTAANFEGATSVNVTGGTPSKDLTGLIAEQKYYARVKPDCDTEGNLWSDAISFTPTDAYSITVYANGTDSETSYGIPMYGNYFDDYTKSECIIPATELSTIQWGQITSITFYAKTVGTSNTTWANTNQKVFVKEVNSTTLGGSYSGMDGATIVFDGLLPMPTTSTDGYTITFSQPYTYSGGNLLIGVYNVVDGKYNNVTWYGKTDLTSGVSAYGSNDNSLASVGYNAQTFLPKTTFNYIPGSAPSCLPPTGLAATEDQPNQSELSWTANNGETSWNIYYKKASAASYTEIADVTDNPYTLPNLDPATQYQFYVVANCTETSDPSAVFPFTTACGIISTYPWNENFDSYTGVTSGSTNNLPLCWNYINTSTDNNYKGYPVVYNGSSYSYSGNNYLRFYSYSYLYYGDEYYDPQPQYAILPEMQSLNTKQIEMYARYYTSGSSFKVGVMSDPDDASTFVQIGDPITPTSSYQKYIVSLEEYTGSGTHIAIMIDAGSNGNSKSVCIDDISVKPLPDCATPTGLAVTANSQTPEGATITWTAGEGTAWTVEYKKTADENWTAVTPNVTATTYTFTGLDANTAYQARVSVVCSAGSGVTYPTDPVGFTTDVACPAPKNLVVSNITDTQAVLTWTPGYTETEWTVKYKKHADEEYTMVTPNVTTTPTVTLEGLTGATAYDVQIIGCEPTHIYTVSNAFSTAYGLPFTEAFTTNSQPANWNQYSGLMDNILAGTETLASANSWIFSNTYVFGQYHAKLNVHGTSIKHWLATPNITIGNNNYTLNFDLAETAYNSASAASGTRVDDKFAVLITEDNGATWTQLALWDNAGSARVFNNITNTGEEVNIDLSSYKNKTVRIAFYGESTESNGDNDMHIDNVNINLTPACYRPSGLTASNVTNHSATLTWLPGSNEQTAWEFKYNKGADFDPTEAGTLVEDIDENPYTFDKTLDASSTYYFYVRGNCGGEPSAWSKKVCSFTTESAAPAPTTFAKTGVGPDWVDLYWNAPTGDYLSGYGIYYSTISTAPTEETAAIVTINNPTAPTSENPYRLPNLENEHTYYIWVRANHEANVYSAWTQLAYPYYITTLVACPAPINVEIDETTLTHTTADLTWTGYSDSYTVEYQTSAYQQTVFFDDFENGIGDWTVVTEGEGPGWALSTDYSHSTSHSMTTYSYDFTNWSSYDADNWLISPQITMGKTLKFWAYQRYSDEYEVLFSTSNSISSFNTELQAMATVSPSQTWVEFTIDLTTAGIEGQTGYIAIHHVYENGGWLSIDDFGIYGDEVPAGGWAEATTLATDGAYTIEGLDSNTKYDVRVKGNCDPEGEWSNILSFTTVMTWEDLDGTPTIGDDVVINQDVIIADGEIANANSITLGAGAHLIIEDGGQLYTNTTVEATVKKSTSHSAAKDAANWYTISSPVNNIAPGAVTNLIQATETNYDLYYYDEATTTWFNHKAAGHAVANMTNGKGFLYWNANGDELDFTGDLNVANVVIAITKTGDGNLAGFNLIGNPFSHNIYKGADGAIDSDKLADGFYVLDNSGAWGSKLAYSTPIKPCQGVLVQATESFDLTITNSTTPATGEKRSNDNNIMFVVSNSQYEDATFALFKEGIGLTKINHRNGDVPMVYIPQDGENYAIATMGDDTETFGLNFKAMTTGMYTLSYKAEGMYSYLHVIDRLTGEDIDMLNEGKYEFIGSPYDNDARFIVKLSYSANGFSSDEFIYQNGDKLIVNGEGELQVYDVTGRMVMITNINGIQSIEAPSTGVYIFRLVGSDVKTQKIVVR